MALAQRWQRVRAGWRSLTVRITVLATAATALVLFAVLAGVVALFSHQLDASIDDGLRTRLGYLRDAVGETGPSEVTREPFAEVFDHGRVVASSSTLANRLTLLPDPAAVSCPGPPVFTWQTVVLLSHPEPVRLRVLAACLPADRILALAVSVQPQEEAQERLLMLLALVAPILLSLVAVTVGRAIHGALRRVDALTRQAAHISAGTQLATSWPAIPGNDEIARLAATLEAMLARLAVAFAREQAFVDEASHELRTPIAVLRGEIELALSDLADSVGVEQSLRAALAEAERLSSLVTQLLELARQRTPPTGQASVRTDVGAVLLATGDRLARTSPIALDLDVPSALYATLEAASLERVLVNLVTNAAAAGATRVAVTGGRAAHRVLIVVADDGPGFVPEFLPSAFERFSRADRARTRTAGAGLGLALVHDLISAAGGEVSADNGSALGGAAVRFWLPAAGPG